MDEHFIKNIQEELNTLGYKLDADGKLGPKTYQAILGAIGQGASPADTPGPATSSPPVPALTHINPKFDAISALRLSKAHPELIRFMNIGRDRIEFVIADSQRGREAQEDAFRRHATRAHFGDSAHNYDPAIALDVWPERNVNWSDIGAFRAIQDVLGWYDPDRKYGHALALELRLGIRHGADWNMNDKPDEKLVDWPHYELHPWRQWAKQSHLYMG